MAYQTGSATNPTDLLGKLKTFAEGIGWTSHRWVAGANGIEYILSHANAGYFGLIADDRTGLNASTYAGSTVTVYGFTSFSSGLGTTAQPGINGGSISNDLEGPYSAYHLFGTTQYIHVVVEVRTGVYTHFGFGKHNKSWNYTGGEYTYGTAWSYTYISNNTQDSGDFVSTPGSNRNKFPFSSNFVGSAQSTYFDYVRCDIDGVSPYWFRQHYSAPRVGDMAAGYPNSYAGVLGARYIESAPSTFNGLAPLFPIVNTVCGVGPSNYIIGSVPDMRSVHMRYLQPGGTMTIGSDSWVTFPVKRHSLAQVPENEPWSATYGIAYKKIV